MANIIKHNLRWVYEEENAEMCELVAFANDLALVAAGKWDQFQAWSRDRTFRIVEYLSKLMDDNMAFGDNFKKIGKTEKCQPNIFF